MHTRNRIAIPAAALIVAAGQAASAQEANVQSLISPNEQSVEFGVIGAFDEPSTTGMYTGLAAVPALPIADGTFIHRDEQTGTWLKATGADLGLDSRGLRLEYERQGDWKSFLDFNQIHKSNPLDIFTGLSNVDSNSQTVNGTSRRDLSLSTDRYNGTFGLSKRFSKDLDLQVSFSSEYKNGRRQFGSQGVNFLVDPIDQWVHEAEAKLNYTGKALQLTGGFLGSFFENKHNVLGSNGGVTAIALPPDNQAYNFYLNGGYIFTPATQGNFKFSYNFMNQTDKFYTAPDFPGNSRTDLGGEVHNYLGQIGISSRATKDLTLRGKVRYEGRHDDTEVTQYVTVDPERNGRNVTMSRSTVTADGEASYRLPDNYRLTGTVKYEYWDRTHPPLRQVSWRTRTDEYSGRAQISKRLTESLGGNLAYIYSTRTGSAYLDASTVANEEFIDPITWGDRERHQWRVSLDWAPMDKLSLQAMIDGALDTYHSSQRKLGPENGQSHNAAIDASYQLTRDWSLTAFVSRNEIAREQKHVDQSGNIQGPWTADIRSLGYAGGIGVRGTPKDRLKVGADIQYSYDKSEHELSVTRAPDLPDIAYRQFNLKLFADYGLSDNASVKFSYGYTHLENSDFTYDINIYTDGTIIRIPDRENSHFVGVSYKYRW